MLKNNRLSALALAMLACVLGGCGDFLARRPDAEIEAVPRPRREFRAAWVATVYNINWPSTSSLLAAAQQHEAIAILDTLAACRFNAVILQVRPQCDAFYPSELEPWSRFLTGRQGRAPEPFYDPLAFWIQQAHDRGLELHAWFNPYRAHTGKAEPPDTSIVKRRPDLARRLANGLYWLDPSLQETQDYSYNVVMDVLRRYDVDGIHFDDYFYPYPSYNDNKDFPDEDSWQAYLAGGGRLSRADWRRQAVDTFIERLYRGIKKEKPAVKFGLSPFGIWRSGHPEHTTGLDQYNVLYADAKGWLNKGWVDYYTPQLYWPIRQINQSFPVLLGWWAEQNHHGRHLWPGINVTHGHLECVNQIMVTRGMLADNPGTVHWHVGMLEKDDGQLAKALQEGPYAVNALAPATPWLDTRAPARPMVTVATQGDTGLIRFSHPDPNDVFRWVVYTQRGGKWSHHILNRTENALSVPKSRISKIGVSAVNRSGNESAITFINKPW